MRSLMIVGTGKMAEAIVKGLCGSVDLRIVGRDPAALERIVHACAGEGEIKSFVLEEGVDIEGAQVLLAIKPYALEAVASKLKGEAHGLFSILAGTTLETLKAHIPARHYLRMMPNLAAAYGASMTTLCGDRALAEEGMQIARGIGSALWLEQEQALDIATAIAGSGPAFLALVAEALADGGVRAGLKREDASSLVEGLFAGMGPLLAHYHPALLKDAVMSPGGTTAAGYAALEKRGVRDACIEAVKEAYERARGG